VTSGAGCATGANLRRRDLLSRGKLPGAHPAVKALRQRDTLCASDESKMSPGALPVVIILRGIEARIKPADLLEYLAPPHHTQPHFVAAIEERIRRRLVINTQHLSAFVDMVLIAVDKPGSGM